MRKYISVFVLLIASPLILSAFVFLINPMATWENSLAPAGEGIAITLITSGTSNYKIVGEQSPDAAEFLRENLELLTGATFTNEAPFTITLKEDMPTLGMDGYAIEIEEGHITLRAKGSVGMMNAVTSFLEEDLGWRYYQKNQGAVAPMGEITEATVVPRQYIPPFFQRSAYSYWAFDPDWALANKTRKGQFGEYFVHTSFEFIPPAEFSESHPEYFALVNGERVTRWQDGQLCMTEPGVRTTMVERVIAAIESTPGIEFIAVDQMDSEGYCQCSNCAALLEEEQHPSGPLLHFVNAVAAEVGKVYPDVTLVTDAYRYSLIAPETVRPAENVVVRLCFNNRIATYPAFFVRETDDIEILRDWSEKTDRLLTWDYMTDFRHYLKPRADLPVLETNIKLYKDKNVSGVMMQSNYSNEIGTQAAMRAWLCAKLLWNPDLSIERLAHDYIHGFWGKEIAPMMLNYNELLISEWCIFHDNNQPGATFRFSEDFYTQASGLLEEALGVATSNPILTKELEIEELTLDHYLLERGVKTPAEVPDYNAFIEQFTQKLEKHNITHLAEGAYDKYLEYIERYKDGALLVDYTVTIPADHIVLPATWNVYFHIGGVTDEQSLVGRSMKQMPGTGWDVQWRFVDFPQLVPGEYDVKIRARADKNRPSGLGTLVGVHSQNELDLTLSHSIQSADLDDEEYQWIDCGILTMTSDTLYLYTSTVKDGAFDAFYIDAVEFIPVSP